MKQLKFIFLSSFNQVISVSFMKPFKGKIAFIKKFGAFFCGLNNDPGKAEHNELKLCIVC